MTSTVREQSHSMASRDLPMLAVTILMGCCFSLHLRLEDVYVVWVVAVLNARDCPVLAEEAGTMGNASGFISRETRTAQ